MKYTEINRRPFEVHMMILDYIATGSSVLELGCATGYFSKELKEKNCIVTGVELEQKAADLAKKYCNQVIVGDLENTKDLKLPAKFETILLMDVIEHIIHRDELLQSIHRWLSKDGYLLLTTPNITHISIRWNVLLGNFTYTKIGIMDETHVHFYTKKTLLTFLIKNNFNIISIEGSADFGQIPYLGRVLKHIPKSIQYKITQKLPTLLAVQFVVRAKKI